MGRKLPPFAAVRAFEAAARHLSFKQAADELCLSPSAVSHQIRSLEAYLDTALFERAPGGIRLTLTGAAYAGRLTQLLDGIDSATSHARVVSQRQTLRIECTPGFAARWLVPRLSRFEHAPCLRLQVSVGAPSVDFRTNGADLVIQWADTPVEGCEVTPLMYTSRFPVVSPALRDAAGLAAPEDLHRVTLIHDETMDMWGEWFAAAGIAPPPMPAGPQYPNCELATTAVEQGQGVSLAYDHMVRDTLASGRVVRLFKTVTLPFTIYAVVNEAHRSDEPLIRAFRDFVFAEIAADARPPTPLRAVPDTGHSHRAAAGK